MTNEVNTARLVRVTATVPEICMHNVKLGPGCFCPQCPTASIDDLRRVPEPEAKLCSCPHNCMLAEGMGVEGLCRAGFPNHAQQNLRDQLLEVRARLESLSSSTTLHPSHVRAEIGLILGAFPALVRGECRHDVREPNHTMIVTHDLRTGHDYESSARCKLCGETFLHPSHPALNRGGEHGP